MKEHKRACHITGKIIKISLSSSRFSNMCLCCYLPSICRSKNIPEEEIGSKTAKIGS
jgi:hypothetical protein